MCFQRERKTDSRRLWVDGKMNLKQVTSEITSKFSIPSEVEDEIFLK
jgi:hypothetical protein